MFVNRLTIVFALFGAVASSVRAETIECTPSPGVSAPFDDTRPADALMQMLAMLGSCQRDAIFLAALGQMLNQRGRYLDAAMHLERALMFNPQLKDVQLSYAIALAGSGDLASAGALIDDLLADPQLPPSLRELIAERRSWLNRGPVNPYDLWRRRYSLSARLGYDSNLLGSPDLNSLALTFIGQTVILPLEEHYLARGGAYTRVDAAVQAQHHEGTGVSWEINGNLRNRYSPHETETGSTQLDLLLERSHYQPSNKNISAERGSRDIATDGDMRNVSGTYANAGATLLRSQTGPRYLAVGAAAGWGREWPHGEADICRLRVGIEIQDRQYLDNDVLSGRYSGVAAMRSCINTTGRQWLVGTKIGTERAHNAARPGGEQRQASLRLASFQPLADLLPGAGFSALKRSGLLVDFEQGWKSDLSSYSQLIESGRSRNVRRSDLRVELQHPVANDMQWTIGLEKAVQVSNLKLFGMSNWGGYVGLRVTW